MYHVHLKTCLIRTAQDLAAVLSHLKMPEDFDLNMESFDQIPKNLSDWNLIFADVSDHPKWASDILEQAAADAVILLFGDLDALEKTGANLQDPRIEEIWEPGHSRTQIKWRLGKLLQHLKEHADALLEHQYLSVLLDSTPSMVWVKDVHGIHTKLNPSFCRVVGKSMEDVTGKDHNYIWDVEPGLSEENDCSESDREVMESRHLVVNEEIVQSGQEQKVLTTYKSPLIDFDGSVMGTIGIGIDITQERLYEGKIVQKNKDLETIFTTTDCGILCHTLDGGQILKCNKKALQILDYDSIEELHEDHFFCVSGNVLEEDKPKIFHAIEQCQKLGETCSVEYRVMHRDGNLRHVLGTVKLVEQEGRPFIHRFLLDVTEQKRQEEENERYRNELIQALCTDYLYVSFLNLASQKPETRISGFTKHDPNRQATASVSKADSKGLASEGSGFKGSPSKEPASKGSAGKDAESFQTNQPPFSILGLDLDSICEEDRTRFAAVFFEGGLERELEHKEVFYINFQVRQSSSLSYYLIKAVRSGIWNEQEKGVVLGLRNVNDQIRTEMEQRQVLEDALNTAQAANKAKSIFLSNMSHDIRTPMNAILGFAELAKDHIDNQAQVQDYLGKIHSSGKDLLHLITDILDMSSFESGLFHFNQDTFTLSDLLFGLKDSVADLAAQKQQTLLVEPGLYGSDLAEGDRSRLLKALGNVAKNAVQYTQNGGRVRIRLNRTSSLIDNKENYVFVIEDNGTGMSEQFLENVFSIFSMVRTSTMENVQGNGLGMAITKSIIDHMGGFIELQSAPGAGTTVTITVPLKHLKEEVQNAQTDVQSALFAHNGDQAAAYRHGDQVAACQPGSHQKFNADGLHPDRAEGQNTLDRTHQKASLPHNTAESIHLHEPSASLADDKSQSSHGHEPHSMIIRPWITRREIRDHLQQAEASSSILLVEDNILNQEIAGAILEDAGFQVDYASNGQEAIECLAKAGPLHYSIVLMDIQMPIMDGYEATRQIRRLPAPELASIPIVAMTANAFEEDKKNAMEAGMNAHLPKPIDPALLIDTIYTMTSQSDESRKTKQTDSVQCSKT